jgi:hypothetical protein
MLVGEIVTAGAATKYSPENGYGSSPLSPLT